MASRSAEFISQRHCALRMYFHSKGLCLDPHFEAILSGTPAFRMVQQLSIPPVDLHPTSSADSAVDAENSFAMIALAHHHLVHAPQWGVTTCAISDQEALSASLVDSIYLAHGICSQDSFLALRGWLSVGFRSTERQWVEIAQPDWRQRSDGNTINRATPINRASHNFKNQVHMF